MVAGVGGYTSSDLSVVKIKALKSEWVFLIFFRLGLKEVPGVLEVIKGKKGIIIRFCIPSFFSNVNKLGEHNLCENSRVINVFVEVVRKYMVEYCLPSESIDLVICLDVLYGVPFLVEPDGFCLNLFGTGRVSVCWYPVNAEIVEGDSL